jgi:hypothetical protein
MHYSFPQEMVDTLRAYMVDIVQALTKYQKPLEILREMGVDVDRIIELLKKLFRLLPL